jgi:hypothetical protein
MRSVIDFERALLGILWLSWLVYWLAAAQRTAPNKRMETLLEGASYRIPLAIGVFLMVFWRMPLFLRIPALWTQSPLGAGIGLVFTVAGLCFAVWARMHLGKYWSGRIYSGPCARTFIILSGDGPRAALKSQAHLPDGVGKTLTVEGIDPAQVSGLYHRGRYPIRRANSSHFQ